MTSALLLKSPLLRNRRMLGSAVCLQMYVADLDIPALSDCFVVLCSLQTSILPEVLSTLLQERVCVCSLLHPPSLRLSVMPTMSTHFNWHRVCHQAIFHGNKAFFGDSGTRKSPARVSRNLNRIQLCLRLETLNLAKP